MKKQILLIVAFLTFSLNSFSAKKDSVVATVNGSPILQNIFDQTYKQNLLFLSGKKITKRKVLYDLINREIGIQRAKKNKLDQDPIVRRKMEDILFHAQVSKDLEPQLNIIKVSDYDVQTYYKNYPEYRTAHILMRVPVEASENQRDSALTQLLKIYRELEKDQSKFPELANKFTQTSAAPNGGDIGFQPATRLAPEYFKAIKNKPVNFISKPVKTQFGYHIVKILAKKNYNQIDQPLYKKIVYDIKRDKIITGYFKKLRKKSTITVIDKYLK
ncbi:MAG: peptidylprolyl isomerase [Bacteriovoracaceae bacterium]|nr:peptidylprolyl isomerase [Bacteriovoracaceae bacterium]